MSLSKSEKCILEVMNKNSNRYYFMGESNFLNKKINKVVEKYFIDKGWMAKDGSFKMNKGGELCLGYFEKRGWL